MAKQMEQLGILTEIDMAAFAGYCQAYARWKEAEEFITQHGTIAVSYTHLYNEINGEEKDGRKKLLEITAFFIVL